MVDGARLRAGMCNESGSQHDGLAEADHAIDSDKPRKRSGEHGLRNQGQERQASFERGRQAHSQRDAHCEDDLQEAGSATSRATMTPAQTSLTAHPSLEQQVANLQYLGDWDETTSALLKMVAGKLHSLGVTLCADCDNDRFLAKLIAFDWSSGFRSAPADLRRFAWDVAAELERHPQDYQAVLGGVAGSTEMAPSCARDHDASASSVLSNLAWNVIHKVVQNAIIEALPLSREIKGAQAFHEKLRSIYTGNYTPQRQLEELAHALDELGVTLTVRGSESWAELRALKGYLGVVTPWLRSVSAQWTSLELGVEEVRSTESMLGKVQSMLDVTETLLADRQLARVMGADTLSSLVQGVGAMRQTLSQVQQWQALPGDARLDDYLGIVAANPLVKKVLDESTLELGRVLAQVQRYKPYPSDGPLSARLTWLASTLADPALREQVQPRVAMVLGDEQANQLFAIFQWVDRLRHFPADSALGAQALWLLDTLSQHAGDTPTLAWLNQFQAALGADPATVSLASRLLTFKQSPESRLSLMRDLSKAVAPSLRELALRQVGERLLPTAIARELEKFWQDSSATESWTSLFQRLAQSIVAVTKPYAAGALMNDPLAAATVQYAEALQQHTSWEETLRWFATHDLSQDKALQLVYGQYLNAMLVWQVYQALNSAAPNETEDKLRHLARQLKDYQMVKSYPQLEKLIDLIPLLPALREAQTMVSAQPSADSWLGWVNQWLEALAGSKSPSLVTLRDALSRKVENWVADAAMSAFDAAVQLPSRLLPGAAAASVPPGTTAAGATASLATVASGLGANWQLGAGIGLEALGVAAIGYAIWQWRHAVHVEAQPPQDSEMQDMLAPQPATTQPQAETAAFLPSEATNAETVPSTGKPTPKLPLLMGLAGVGAMAAGGALLHRWATSDASAAAHASEYQQALEVFREFEVPDLSFLFYEELADENTSPPSNEASVTENENTPTETRANRLRRSASTDSASISQQIDKLLSDTGLREYIPIKILFEEVGQSSEVKRAKSSGRSPETINVITLLKAIEYYAAIEERYGSEIVEKCRPVIDGLWRIANSLSDEYGREKVRAYKAAFLIDSPSQFSSQSIPELIENAIRESGLEDQRTLPSVRYNVDNLADVTGAREGAEKNVARLLGYLKFLPPFIRELKDDFAAPYRQLLDKLWSIANGLSDDFSRAKISEYKQTLGVTSPPTTTPSTPSTTAATTRTPSATDRRIADMTRSAEHTVQNLEALNDSILDPLSFIDDYIKKGVLEYTRTTGIHANMTPNSMVEVICPPSPYDMNLLPPRESAPSELRLRVKLRDVVTGQYLYDFKNQRDSLGRRYPYPRITFEPKDLIAALTSKNLQTEMETALAVYRGNASNRAGMTSLYQNMMRLRCVQYLESESANQVPAHRKAVLDFLAGNIQAKEVLLGGKKLNGVFLIPVDQAGGLLFSVDEPTFFEVGNKQFRYRVDTNRVATEFAPVVPATAEFKRWTLSKVPGSHAHAYKDKSPSDFEGEIKYVQVHPNLPGSRYLDSPFTFSPSSSQGDLANKLYDGLMDRLDSDIDYLVFSSYEQKLDHALEVGKAILMLASLGLNVAVPGTGTLLNRVGLFLANLTLDATYVGMAATQAQLADRPEDASRFRNEAIFAGILGALGAAAGAKGLTTEGIAAARQLYRQANFASGNIIPSALSRVNWIKLADPKKIDVLVDTVKESQSARQLANLTTPAAVMQSMRSNLELNAEGAAKTSFTWNEFSVERTWAERRLTSDLARLTDANKHMRRILDVPPMVSRYLLPGAPKEEAAGWIARAGSTIAERTTGIQQVLSDYANADVFDINTINRIYDAVYPRAAGQTARTFRSSSDSNWMGSDIARAGFEKALNEIKLKVDARNVQAGPALYAAIMRYRPYVDGNQEIARTLYALEQLKRQESTFKSLTSEAEHLLGTEDVSLAPPPAQPREAAAPVETRRVIANSPSTDLPVEMRPYLSELRAKPGIADKMMRPSENSEAVVVDVANFMKEKGMQDVRYRGMYIWTNGMDEMPINHFAVLGTKNGETYVFDLTAGQFGNRGMPLLEGPLILPEAAWALRYQSAATTKLMKYKDFDNFAGARDAFRSTTRQPAKVAINGAGDTYVLAEPGWYRLDKAEADLMKLGAPWKTLSSEELATLARERTRYESHVDRVKARNLAEFNVGRDMADEAEPFLGVDRNMSELDLTRSYNDSSISFSIRQRGVLSEWIEAARRKRLTAISLSVATEKYGPILSNGCAQKRIAPQAFLLTAAEASEQGRCLPMVLSLAVAIKNGEAENFMANLYYTAAQAGKNSKLIQALDLLHGTSVQPHLRRIDFLGNVPGRTALDEIPGGTVRQIVDELESASNNRLYSLDSKTHAMMVGITVNNAGGKAYHFYDPNIGYFSYSSARELRTAMENTIGTRALSGQYQAYGTLSAPRYLLSEIDTTAVGAIRLQIQGGQSGETLTVRGLSGPDLV
ncbi:hypothetical protein [Burkholderia ubonensis]|uniref:hypothetical protein n=1 Tax=Burkholderia ubonensis TaxID=101571 RepID=UPI000A45232F|nr:hypothetical protein [Burkholderia ubonensis]